MIKQTGAEEIDAYMTRLMRLQLAYTVVYCIQSRALQAASELVICWKLFIEAGLFFPGHVPRQRNSDPKILVVPRNR
jgi:hypothetical protein